MVARTLFLLLFISHPTLVAQQITVHTVTSPIEVLTINDIDFLHSTTPKWLFSIEIAVVPAGTVDVIMKITLDAALTSGESFPGAAYVETIAFTVSSVRTVTNIDLQQRGFVRTSSTDDLAKRRFEETALPSGAMPPGLYSFRVEVEPVSGGTAGRDVFRFDLTNPSAIELLIPLDGDIVTTQFPLFQWIFDGGSARISIYERLEGQTGMEETASGIPHLEEQVSTSFFQYPSAGVRTLQPGRTYVWFVEGLVRQTGGADLKIMSPLRSFTVAAAASTSTVDTSILDELERALGPNYKPLFDQIRAEGYSPSGTVRLDGRPISIVDLLQMINQFRDSPDGILSVRVE